MSITQPSVSQRFSSAGWGRVMIIAGAGVVSAFQVGKAPMALSAVQTDFGLSLVIASWIISAFAIVGTVAGAPVGLAVDRIGAKRMVVGGLMLQAIGAGLGSASTGMQLLMMSRVIEGLGFLTVFVSAPAMIFATVSPRIQDRAIAVWAAVMPVGMTVVMLCGPLLTVLEWRGFWLMNAACLFVYAVFVALAAPTKKVAAVVDESIGAQLKQTIAAPGPRAIAALFAAFSGIFFVVFGFLPSLLINRFGLSQDLANLIAAVAIAASGIGNLAAGLLLSSGRTPLGVLTAGFVAMAILGLGVLAVDLPWMMVAISAVSLAFMAGLVPVVLMDSVPRFAPRPELIGATLGLAMQGNNAGMLVGPAVGGMLATSYGWPSVAAIIVVISTAAVLFARASFSTAGNIYES